MKNSNYTIGNRTRNLPTLSAVPQPNALPRAPKLVIHYITVYLPYKWSLLPRFLIFQLTHAPSARPHPQIEINPTNPGQWLSKGGALKFRNRYVNIYREISHVINFAKNLAVLKCEIFYKYVRYFFENLGTVLDFHIRILFSKATTE